MINNIIRKLADERGALAIMYAMLLPVFALLLSLAIDGSMALQKKARLADIVTESLVAASTHRYDDQRGGQTMLEKNLTLHFPDDTIVNKKLTLTVNQNGNQMNYQHTASAAISSPNMVSPVVDGGFGSSISTGYQSPTLNQSTKTAPLLLVQDSNTLVDTGVGIDADGKVWVWGFRGSGQSASGTLAIDSASSPSMVPIPNKVTKVTGGIYHLLALDEKGNVWAWGQSGYGEAGRCNGVYSTSPCNVLSGVVDIAAGEYTSVMLTESGDVYFMGHCAYSQCGSGSQTAVVSSPTKVSLAGEKAVKIGGAYEGTLAITVNGSGVYSVWGWGDNEGCGLGATQTNVSAWTAADGSSSRCKHGIQDYTGLTASPYRIKGLKDYASHIVYLGGGQGFGAALLDDGRVIGWGTNYHLGRGWSAYTTAPHTNLDVTEPIIVATGVAELQVRYPGGAYLTSDNKLYTFGGDDKYFVYGPTPKLRASNVSSFSVGKEHLFYNNAEGKLYGVGYCAGNKFFANNCATHPLYYASAINWPGVELDFSRFGLTVGVVDDPTLTPTN
ncbi:hypothetical protein [Entomohabitans teleogrylli]|uniref:hypothetical protein n=1 Tax=Entomohabitans teleogrylli TaxID=1384589 RepID=UPI00073D3191|nr:hypothetical protein [Entomohabitans teleogrylli]